MSGTTMEWWYTYFRRRVARGYQPRIAAAPVAEWPIPLPQALPSEWLLAFCPTFVGADNEKPQTDTIAELAYQLHDARREGLPPCVLVVGMQHAPADRSEAVRRLARLAALLKNRDLTFAGFCLGEFGKVKSVNVALAVAQTRNAQGLLQIDDDIHLEAGCIQALYRTYRQAGRGLAVGATKTGLARRNGASRLLRWLKGQTRAATNYPHACCLLLDPRLLAGGIPRRYTSDDGYICFHLLRPQEAEPFRLLRLVPQARCTHYVGGTARQSARRIRRMLLNHHIYLADFPVEVARFYLREILFPGFWPLGSKPEHPSPLRWFLQSLYFAWFCLVGLELTLRGLLNRPLHQIPWAGVQDRQRPTTSQTVVPQENIA